MHSFTERSTASYLVIIFAYFLTLSTLYSLVDFVDEDGIKIRKDESYEKNYLLGKYGAIPTLKYFDIFSEG